MEPTEIKAGKVSIIIRPHKEWSAIYLKCNERTIKLGEEKKSIFINRVLENLTDRFGKTIDKIEGVDVRWVVTLSVEYCTVYAGVDHDDLILFVQSKEGCIIEKVKLNKYEVDQLLYGLNQIKGVSFD